MDKKLIQEINKIKRLSNLNESQLNEGVITDIIHFFEIASDEILQTDTVKKLKNYFQSIIPGLGGNISNETEIEKDIDNKLENPLTLTVTSDDDDFYKQILKDIEAPITDENMLFMYGWRQSEHTEARNNPFATTKSGFGGKSVSSSSAGVKNYPTKEDGINATVATLKNGYYDCIVDGLKNNIGAKKISQKCNTELKTWGTHATTDLITQVLSGWEKRGVKEPPEINSTHDMV
jgi:hypothetical protein